MGTALATSWTRAELLLLARKRFGVRHFRPGQAELMEAVLAGQSALGILPSGAGKSLTYQLPALLLERPTVVVSPLIALMQDQQEKLEGRHIHAAKLDSTLKVREERAATAEIERGEHELIYITPERLENESYRALLEHGGVGLLVVDEAHCISQWGHDFRPAFLAVRDAVVAFGRPPVLALTATATPDVADDIRKQLGMPEARVIYTGVERDNLFLEVVRTPRASEKREQLRTLLSELKGSGIVYVGTVRLARELHAWLTEQGLSVGLYHGKLRTAERERNQHAFMNDELKVMLATSAFGLGIDKHDIRFVIHYNFPDSLETYYQEAGRAGRDGKPARVVLLYRLEDRQLQAFFLGGKYPRRDESERVLSVLRKLLREKSKAFIPVSELADAAAANPRRTRVVMAQLEGAGIVTRKGDRVSVCRDVHDARELDGFLREYEERHRSDHERLDAMMRYAQSRLCRMRYVRQYFGDDVEQDCGHCDNCRLRARRTLAPKLERPSGHTTSAASPGSLEGPALERLIASAVGSVGTERVGAAPHGVSPEALQPGLRKPPPQAFARGQRVQHRAFGSGEVLSVVDGKVSVDFPSAGVKRLDGRYLETER